MNDKIKRRLAIAGALVISIALVIVIGMQFAKEPAKPDASSQEPVSSSDVVSDIQKNTEKKEIVVPPQTALEPEASETLPPQTDLPEQKLQPDPVKPEAPKKPDLPKDADTKNPSKPPEYKPEATEKKPPAPESKPQSSGGLPGFDNVPDGGANQVIEGKSDGDINKQVGEMD
jgi:outer membrane biosynthesis protein TonB